MNNKLKKIIFDLIDSKTKGVDTYHHNGSMWLIFTDQKKWVIEFTKQGTLWYNFNFFKQFFKYLSLDVIENQDYITQWVEDTIQNGVRSTQFKQGTGNGIVEDTIQNGVRSTDSWSGKPFVDVGHIIQNGVRNTDWSCLPMKSSVEDTIQNGVINTLTIEGKRDVVVEDTIQNGVINTFAQFGGLLPPVEDTIQNGVKETTPSGYLGSIEMKGKIVHQLESPKQNNEVEDVIENGVKRTVSYKDRPEPTVEGIIQSGIKETKQEPSQRTWKVGEVIKETKSPGADGDLLSTIEWMESNNTESVPKMIDDIITNGIKETKKIDHDRTTYHGYFNRERGSHTPLDTVQNVLKNGIKHTQPHVLEILNPLPDQSGELNGYGEYYARQKNRTYPHIDTVNDVIRDGVKETWGYERQPQTRVNDVIQTGKKI
jgi:hypothetical protein